MDAQATAPRADARPARAAHAGAPGRGLAALSLERYARGDPGGDGDAGGAGTGDGGRGTGVRGGSGWAQATASAGEALGLGAGGAHGAAAFDGANGVAKLQMTRSMSEGFLARLDKSALHVQQGTTVRPAPRRPDVGGDSRRPEVPHPRARD